MKLKEFEDLIIHVTLNGRKINVIKSISDISRCGLLKAKDIADYSLVKLEDDSLLLDTFKFQQCLPLEKLSYKLTWKEFKSNVRKAKVKEYLDKINLDIKYFKDSIVSQYGIKTVI